MIIGAQLYTVRDYCKTMQDLEETLKKVADIGYTSVQLSAVCPYEGEEMAALLKKTGLTADLTHYDYKKTVHDTDAVIALHDTIGCRYIGLGYPPYPFTEEGMTQLANELKEPLQKIVAAGHKFMYHNHNLEFARLGKTSEGGKTLLEFLCDQLSPEEFGVTLDCYWAQAGGMDPADLIRKMKGRVDCIHLKDMVYSLADKNIHMAPVGGGNMNYEAILAAALDSNVQYAFVEQDDCYGEDPFACLAESYQNIKTLLG